MEFRASRQPILRNLALIYIALAHGSDEDLSKEEIDMISQRLRSWQTEVTSETVLSAIKDALEEYTLETAGDELEHAIQFVKENVSPELRQLIVEDLTEIAMADDKFLHEESSFIDRLAHAWDVHVDAPAGDLPWNVLNQSGENGAWTAIHDLALVYLHLAHRTDDELSTAEVDAIAVKLREWIPDANESAVLKVVQQAMGAYVQGPDKRLFEDSVAALKKNIPYHQRRVLLSDLNFVATADGRLIANERKLIDQLARAWNISLEEQPPAS